MIGYKTAKLLKFPWGLAQHGRTLSKMGKLFT